MRITIKHLRRIIREELNWAQLDDEEEDALEGIEGRPSEARSLLRDKYNEFKKSPAGKRGPAFFWRHASKDKEFQELFQKAEITSPEELERAVGEVDEWMDKNKMAGLLKLARTWIKKLEDATASKSFGLARVHGGTATSSYSSDGWDTRFAVGRSDRVMAFKDPATDNVPSYNIGLFEWFLYLPEVRNQATAVAKDLGKKSTDELFEVLESLPQWESINQRWQACLRELEAAAQDHEEDYGNSLVRRDASEKNAKQSDTRKDAFGGSYKPGFDPSKPFPEQRNK